MSDGSLGSAVNAEENWEVLMSAFPSGWRELAKQTGAVKHALVDFKNEGDLLRVMLIHIGRGYSLRETAVIARESGIADVSDVAILKRLRKAEHWFLELCQKLLAETGVRTPECAKGFQVRMVDASIIKEPGKTGSQWRLHFCVTAPDLKCDYFKISPSTGRGNSESFLKFPIMKNDYIMGDRGYSTSKGVSYVHSKNAYVLVRVNTSSLPLYKEDRTRFDLLGAVKKLKLPLETREWEVYIQGSQGHMIGGRLCVLRKSDEKIAEAQNKSRRKAKKHGAKLRPETLEFAKYVIVFSTFPEDKFGTNDVLEWYRLRWQIELIFKRLKSILHMGHLPKSDPASSRAWLYGKLFLALLAEKIARISRAFSPWGYILPQKQVERVRIYMAPNRTSNNPSPVVAQHFGKMAIDC